MLLRNILYLVLFFLMGNVYSQNTPRFVAEWEPAWGTLIRWPLGIPNSLVVELAADDSLYVLVESPYQRDQAIASFTSWGVNLDYCRFLFAPTYSHWTRDWGPHYVFNEDGIGGIADPEFDGYPWVPGCNAEGKKNALGPGNKGLLGWEEDDAVNIILADSFQCPLISLPVYLTGGNIMVDGLGAAISTQQMLDENIPLASANEFFEILHDSTGISNYIIVDNPEVHGIQHIDCYAKLLDEARILVKQVDENHPEYACCEALAEDLGNRLSAWGEPYEILRIYCGSYDGDAVAAYTNSLFLNNKVLVPLFGIPSDALALQTYAEALPGYEVVGFEWDDWYYYDALHCRTMGIFDRHMLRMVHKPLSGNVIFFEEPKISVYIDDRSEAGLNPEALLLHWREAGSPDWNAELLTPTMHPDTFAAFIPDAEIGTTYEYCLFATDSSGRSESLPGTAPASYHSFYLEHIVGVNPERSKENQISAVPTLFHEHLTITIPPQNEEGRITISDALGNRIESWAISPSSTETILTWKGTDQHGMPCKPGIYFVHFESHKRTETIKCIRSIH